MQRLLELDARITRQLRIAEKPCLLRSIAILFAHSGDSWFWLVGLALVWWQGTETWKACSQAFILSMAVMAGLVFLIKLLVRRRRPAGDWGEIYRKTDPHSFPSGHAARAALFAALALGLGPTWFGLVFLVWAPLVMLARVAMGVHYLSDVLAGALLGVMVGAIALNLIPRLLIAV
jgi:undecaprenyl-diphosphatase